MLIAMLKGAIKGGVLGCYSLLSVVDEISG